MKSIIAPLFLALAATAYSAERPNILFIFSDDHAEHAISAYGSKVNKTPIWIALLLKERASPTPSSPIRSAHPAGPPSSPASIPISMACPFLITSIGPATPSPSTYSQAATTQA